MGFSGASRWSASERFRVGEISTGVDISGPAGFRLRTLPFVTPSEQNPGAVGAYLFSDSEFVSATL